MKLVGRSAWNARGPRSVTRITSTKGVKVHYTGGRVDPKILTDHGRCDDAVRGIQNGHMDGNGWVDIGYSMAVCPHGYVYMGRGPNVLCSANGAGLNTGHYAVLGLVGNAGVMEPTDDMLNGIRDAIDYLREHGGAGKEIKGHQDGYATDCPGERLYAWVKAGAPRPDDASSKPVAAQPNSVETAVNELPTLTPGMTHKHVKTMRALLFARGYEPADMWSTKYGKDAADMADLVKQVNALKAKHDLAQDGVFGDGAWVAALT